MVGVVGLPVSLVFARLISEATLPPGVSQYSPPSTDTRMSVAFGSSGPPGSQASANVVQSSASRAWSSTTVAVPWIDTHASRLENVTPT